jgi:predicted NBD/HSP70 family sugar kinase
VRKIDVNAFTRATRGTGRDINRQIVLNLVHEHQPLSRADLARRMKMSRGRITSMVAELLEEGLIVEGDTVDVPRGRRPKMLRIRTQDRLVVAIDVRFGRTYLMLSDFAGSQIAMESFRTLVVPAELVAELAARIGRLQQAYRSQGRCEGIGLVVPGMVNQRTGRVLNAPQLGWREVDIRDALAEATGLPVFIENAPISSALAQMWLGENGSHGGNFVYISIFEGVGAGVVVNGQVVRGNSHSAGELGHALIDPDGPTCMCGARGCLEAHTSNLATLARYLEVEMGSKEMGARLAEAKLTISDLITRARTGDAKARAALEATGHFLGLGLSIAISALNPARIYVAGDITAAWDIIEPPLRAVLAERALTPAAGSTPVIPDHAAYPRLRGATALVVAQQLAAPQVA